MNNPFRLFPLYSIAILSSLIALTLGAVSRGQGQDARYLEGLRQRQLHWLAETYCHGQLDSGTLSADRRAELTAELVRCYAEHAWNALPDQRERLWRAAHQAVLDFQQKAPNSPFGILVRVQDAIAHLACGELVRQEAELQTAGAEPLDMARPELREAIRILRPLEDEISEQIRLLRRREATVNPSLTDKQLHSLGENVQFQLARALLTQARCFPDDSADRINALNQALDRLNKLSGSTGSEELAWQCRIEQIVCFRLLRRFPLAKETVAQSESNPVPSSLLGRLRLESARIALAENLPQRALEIVNEPDSRADDTPELELARVETYIAMWKQAERAGQEAQATNWQAKAAQTIEAIELRHGRYWLRRAESLLTTAAFQAGGTRNLDLLIRAADNSYIRGQLDDAIAAYDQAAAKAKEAGKARQAFELSFKAASVEHQRENRRQAQQRYRQAALSMPSHPRAAEAHLLAVLSAAMLARQSSDPSLDQYTQLLEEHIQNWPSAPTSDKARRWLGRLLEHQQKWQEAVAVYRQISASFPEFDQVLAATAKCSKLWLSQRKAAAEPYAELAEQTARYFQRMAGVSVSPQAAVWAAEIWLRFTPNGYSAAEKVLRASLTGQRDRSKRRDPAAQCLLIVALAGQAKWRKAQAALQKATDASPENLLQVLDLLSLERGFQQTQLKPELGQLQLAIVSRLWPRSKELDQSQRDVLTQAHAEARALSGQRTEAIKIYAQLKQRLPDNAQVRETYASLLLESDDPAELREALEHWRKLLSRSRPHTDRWFRAKYAIASSHYKLGNREQAAKIIQLTQALSPEMGGPDSKRDFVALLEKCRNGD